MNYRPTSITRRFSILAFSAGLALMPVAPVLAATAPAAAPQTAPGGTGQALEIAPPVISLNINPGQTITTQIRLRDISKGNLIVTGEINDFGAAGEDGTPKLLLKDEGNNPYSLKSWVAPLSKLVIVPKEIKVLPVKITAPANASPGGHYGVVRFTATPAELSDTGVSLSASLGALILVTVSGKTNESLSVKQFYAAHSGQKGSLFESGPVSFIERLQNNGNVHLQPSGTVSVSDMFGKKIAALPVNSPPRNILPSSIRKFDQPLDKTVIGNRKLFGHYTAKLNLTYGTSKKTLAASVGFWVIPYRLIIFIIVILIGGFFLLRYLLRGYNQRVIARAQNSNNQNTPPPSDEQK